MANSQLGYGGQSVVIGPVPYAEDDQVRRNSLPETTSVSLVTSFFGTTLIPSRVPHYQRSPFVLQKSHKMQCETVSGGLPIPLRFETGNSDPFRSYIETCSEV